MSDPLPIPRVLRFDLDPSYEWEDFELAVSRVFANHMPVPEAGAFEGEVVVYIAKPPSNEKLEELAQRCLDKCRIDGSFVIE